MKRRIEFSSKAYYKLSVLLANIDMEFAFHGTVSCPAKDVYRVEDVFLYPQFISPVSVDSDETRYATWLSSLDDAKFASMKLQGHSHADMMAKPSKTDCDLYRDLSSQVKDGQYYLFIIVNREQGIWVEIREGKEIIHDSDIDVVIDDPEIMALFDSMDEMIGIKEYAIPNYTINDYIEIGNGGYLYDRFNEEW